MMQRIRGWIWRRQNGVKDYRWDGKRWIRVPGPNR